LHPQVGIVEYKDFKQISIADLPGLLPDLTRGFGSRYLHHLDKCKIILLTIDFSRNDSLEQYNTMIDLLNTFNVNLLKQKPIIIVGTKIDEDNSYDNMIKFKQDINNLSLIVVPVSAEKKINLTKLMIVLRDLYDKL
jgi:GTPase